MIKDRDKSEIRSLFDSISSDYGLFEGEGERLLSNYEKQQVLVQILGKIDLTMSVLDVGCGWGRYLSLAATHCSTAVGIDMSKQMLLAGKNRFRNQH